MVEFNRKGQEKKRETKIKIFPVPLDLREIKENISIFTDSEKKLSKEKIISQAIKLHIQGNISEARKYYEDVIKQGFKDHRVFSNYGVILKNLGKSKEAELYIRKAIELSPNYAMAHLNLGHVLKDLGKLQEAELTTRKAIDLNPNLANSHLNLGTILKDLGKLKEAELPTRKAIQLNPSFVEAYSNLGTILKDLGKLQAAELSLRKALDLDPNFEMAHLNLGLTLRDLGKLQAAELSLRKALEVNPDFAEAYSNLGNLLLDLGKLQEAEESQRKAIKLKPYCPDFYFNLSLLELLKGDYQSGLEHYEYRLNKKEPININGKTILQKKDFKKFEKREQLLIISEQGLGDTLQFMRYIPYLRELGLDISFCAEPKLHTLIKASNIDANPLTTEKANEVSEGNWIPLLSLLRYLKVRPDNPIISKPYIFSTKELIKKWKNILSKEKRPIIGINWQGNPKVEKNAQKGRSFPLKTFSHLAKNNVKFLSLQKGFGSEQLDDCSFQNKFVECQPEINSTWDFLENAAIIENCDLIITSDTSIAHLAGGMGKSTWLLLQHIPEWRWGLEGENTFWYPSMRLFRQKEKHNWQEVMERVSDQLKTERNSK